MPAVSRAFVFFVFKGTDRTRHVRAQTYGKSLMCTNISGLQTKDVMAHVQYNLDLVRYCTRIFNLASGNPARRTVMSADLCALFGVHSFSLLLNSYVKNITGNIAMLKLLKVSR